MPTKAIARIEPIPVPVTPKSVELALQQPVKRELGALGRAVLSIRTLEKNSPVAGTLAKYATYAALFLLFIVPAVAFYIEYKRQENEDQLAISYKPLKGAVKQLKDVYKDRSIGYQANFNARRIAEKQADALELENEELRSQSDEAEQTAEQLAQAQHRVTTIQLQLQAAEERLQNALEAERAEGRREGALSQQPEIQRLRDLRDNLARNQGIIAIEERAEGRQEGVQSQLPEIDRLRALRDNLARNQGIIAIEERAEGIQEGIASMRPEMTRLNSLVAQMQSIIQRTQASLAEARAAQSDAYEAGILEGMDGSRTTIAELHAQLEAEFAAYQTKLAAMREGINQAIAKAREEGNKETHDKLMPMLVWQLGETSRLYKDIDALHKQLESLGKENAGIGVRAFSMGVHAGQKISQRKIEEMSQAFEQFMTNASKKIAEHQAAIVELTGKLSQKSAKEKALEARIEKLKTLMADQAEQMQRKQEQLDEARSASLRHVDEDLHKVSKAKVTIATVSGSITDLQAALEKLEAAQAPVIKLHTMHAGTLQATIDKQRAANLAIAESQTSAATQALQAEIAQLRQALSDEQGKVEGLTLALAKQTEKPASAASPRSAEAVAAKVAAQPLFGSSEHPLALFGQDSLGEENARLAKEADALRTQSEATSTRVIALERDLTKLRAEHAILVESSSGKAKHLQTSVQMLEGRIAEKQKEIAEHNEENELLHQRFKIVSRAYDKLAQGTVRSRRMSDPSAAGVNAALPAPLTALRSAAQLVQDGMVVSRLSSDRRTSGISQASQTGFSGLLQTAQEITRLNQESQQQIGTALARAERMKARNAEVDRELDAIRSGAPRPAGEKDSDARETKRGQQQLSGPASLPALTAAPVPGSVSKKKKLSKDAIAYKKLLLQSMINTHGHMQQNRALRDQLDEAYGYESASAAESQESQPAQSASLALQPAPVGPVVSLSAPIVLSMPVADPAETERLRAEMIKQKDRAEAAEKERNHLRTVHSALQDQYDQDKGVGAKLRDLVRSATLPRNFGLALGRSSDASKLPKTQSASAAAPQPASME